MRAYAKINLILDVLSKREDGYHNIDFLMSIIDLYDEVYLEKSTKDEIEVTGNLELSNENNLAFKALKLMKQKYGISNNYKIKIIKNIPIAAGMAGGSTDCAAVLHLVNNKEKLSLSDEELAKIGIELGADVSFCIYSKLARVSGIGEKVNLVTNVKNYNKFKGSILVVNSKEELSTKKVYDNYECKTTEKMSIEAVLNITECDEFYNSLRNNLENTAKKLNKNLDNDINTIKKITNSSKVIVSGSGPTILVFDKEEKLKEVKENLLKQKKYQKYYIKIHNML